jgi:hypothetical protein
MHFWTPGRVKHTEEQMGVSFNLQNILNAEDQTGATMTTEKDMGASANLQNTSCSWLTPDM